MRPRDLPEAHRAITRAAQEHVQWRSQYVAEVGMSDLLTVTSLIAPRLPTAELYLVSEPMRDLALDAARDVPDGIRMGAARPASQGVVAYTGGLPELSRGATPEMVSWSQVESGDLTLCAWSRDTAVPIEKRDPHGLTEVQAGGWTLTGVGMVPMLDPIESWDALGPIQRRLASLIYATWTMMSMPAVSETWETITTDKRKGVPTRDRARSVKVVDLRRLSRRPAEPGDGGGREYHHRWVVRGHWRQQAHGPGRSLRRTTWVPSYLKGPDGAPLIASEAVFVWRR